MRVKYLGHSCFLVTTNSGTRILVDPYIAGAPELSYGPVLEESDIVLLSHEHADHGGVSADGLPGKPVVLRGSEPQSVSGIEFLPLLVDHDKAKGAERGKVTVWNFMVDDVRFVHLGDLGRTLSTQELVTLGGRVGVMCVPVGGGAVLRPQDASTVVEKVAPRVAIPMHYRTDRDTIPPSTVDDYLALKQLVQRPGVSEMEFRAGVLPPRYPMSIELVPAM